ncbi:unnamed protein product, partial [Aureobasidium mustum]
ALTAGAVRATPLTNHRTRQREHSTPRLTFFTFLVSPHPFQLVHHYDHNRLVPCTNAIDVSAWKIIVRIENLRRDRDWNLHDCFGSFQDFVESGLNGNVPTTQDIEIEIHEAAGDPTRYIKVTKNTALQAHAVLENFNCDQFDGNYTNYSLDDAVFTDSWRVNALTIKDSIFLKQTLRFSINRNLSLRHLVIENVHLRRFNADFPDIEPADWLDTLQRLQLGNLETCRLANLYDANGDFFVEGVWEVAATPYRSVTDASALATMMQHGSRAARMARFTSANHLKSGLGGGIFDYLSSHCSPEPPQMPSEPVSQSTLLSLPLELIQMIVKLTIDDKKAIQSLRLACKFFKTLELVEKHFRLTYLAHLHVAPTQKLSPDFCGRCDFLSSAIPSSPSLSSTITTTFLIRVPFALGKGDLLLEALEHFHHIGRTVDLNVTVAKPPLDGTSSVIGILYRVLEHVLVGYPVHDQPGVRNITLDIDDTSSAAFPILTDSSEDRKFAECYASRFQHIWTRIAELKALEEVRVRFSKRGEKTKSPRGLTIQQKNGRINVGMNNLSIWHFDIMGRMSIFTDVYWLGIQDCSFEIHQRNYLFNNSFSTSHLQHLVIQNVSLNILHRDFNPPRHDVNPEVWYETMVEIAGTTNLQSLWVDNLIDWDDQILYTQPWNIHTTSQASVTEIILAHYP